MKSTIERVILMRIGKAIRTDVGIIEFHMNNDVHITVDDLIEIMDVHDSLLGDGERLPTLVVTGERNDIDRDARKVDVSHYRQKHSTKEAIVVKNIATRLVVYFYYQFNRPPYPFKVFKTEEEARKWLLA